MPRKVTGLSSWVHLRFGGLTYLQKAPSPSAKPPMKIPLEAWKKARTHRHKDLVRRKLGQRLASSSLAILARPPSRKSRSVAAPSSALDVTAGALALVRLCVSARGFLAQISSSPCQLDGSREAWHGYRTRSSSREVRIRVPTLFFFVYFSRGILPTKQETVWS